ncbi:MAG: O-antigen ligase family protein [Candidatus Binatia bacterium]
MLTAAARPHRDAARVVYSRPVPRSDYAEVPKIVRWSFIGFAGALPFEAVSLAFTAFSLAKLAGLLLIAAYFFFYNPLSGKRSFPSGSAPLAWFLIYLLVFAANGIFLEGFYFRQFVSVFLTLTQLLLLFWISSSLLRVALLTRRALLAFAFASVLLALGTLLEVPGFSTSIESRVGERITALDFNPNYLAYTMALAAVILIGTALEIQVRYSWSKALLIAPVLPLLALTVRTGSRTGVAAFVIGFAVCLLPNRQPGRRLIIMLLCVFVGAAMVALVSQHQTVLARFEQSTSGNLAGRQVIIPASLQMIAERPLFGWQPVAYWEELGRRVGEIWGAKDAHNLVFHLLMEVGLLGAIPFLIGIALCALGAWKARAGKFGNLPFALLMMTLSANLTHTYLARKPQWLILALAVAAATAMQKSKAVRQPLRASGRAASEHVLVANVRRRDF